MTDTTELIRITLGASDFEEALEIATGMTSELIALRQENARLKTYCSALEEQLDSTGLKQAQEKAP